jgi:UDP-GlcNAc:undecaprenyl-phosphate GlcNAc-1-phosphate transferase
MDFFFFNFLAIFIYSFFYNVSDFLNILSVKEKIIYFSILTSALVYGILDDKLDLNYIQKLIIFTILFFLLFTIFPIFKLQFIKFYFYNYKLSLNQTSVIISIFLSLYFLNMLNMFDGINNQLSFILILFSSFLIFKVGFDLILIAFLLSTLSFGLLNYKNKCFLGNAGIVFISFFVITILGLRTNNEIIKLDSLIILFFIPFIDTLRLFFHRILNNKNPFKGDTNHIHHILLKKYGQKKTNLLINGTIFISFLFYEIYNSFFFYLIVSLLIIYFLLVKKFIKNE